MPSCFSGELSPSSVPPTPTLWTAPKPQSPPPWLSPYVPLRPLFLMTLAWAGPSCGQSDPVPLARLAGPPLLWQLIPMGPFSPGGWCPAIHSGRTDPTEHGPGLPAARSPHLTPQLSSRPYPAFSQHRPHHPPGCCTLRVRAGSHRPQENVSPLPHQLRPQEWEDGVGIASVAGPPSSSLCHSIHPLSLAPAVPLADPRPVCSSPFPSASAADHHHLAALSLLQGFPAGVVQDR